MTFLTLDLAPLLAATLAACACALVGNYLVLRRQSLMGDAISHAVLPGIAAAFILTASREPIPMLLGAAAAGLVTVALTSLIQSLGKVDRGAAMGVTFTTLFALGVVLIQHIPRTIDLDADCVLHGNLEALLWFPPDNITLASLATLPRQVHTLAFVMLGTIAFTAVFYKELRLTSFDPALAGALGFRPGLVNTLLMTLAAAAVVASFEAVGSILVIAMLICPPAAARMLTNRLGTQILLSQAIAIATAVGGYFAATQLPPLFVPDLTLNAAGMIATVSGIFVLAAAIVARIKDRPKPNPPSPAPSPAH
ncbi:MAG: metal ABC transporter permease [Phycisphaerales bacterium]|nr:metal ABC transporter permease [Planctomycetota bacterium]MCH8507558.1 metal ABC transporter permease [Phycisphaerales bacterium]